MQILLNKKTLSLDVTQFSIAQILRARDTGNLHIGDGVELNNLPEDFEFEYKN